MARTALGVLIDYYGDKAHEVAGEESTGITELLEMIKSDVSTHIA